MESNTKIENAPRRPKYRWTEDFKGSRPATDLQNAVEKILAAHQLLGRFREGVRFHAQIKLDGSLPLTIAKQDRYVTIAHPFLSDCEPTNDPAMDLELGKDGAWYPVSVELADGDLRQCVDGPFQIDFEERRKQVAFAAKWTTGLLAEGYHQGEIFQLSGEND